MGCQDKSCADLPSQLVSVCTRLVTLGEMLLSTYVCVGGGAITRINMFGKPAVSLKNCHVSMRIENFAATVRIN